MNMHRSSTPLLVGALALTLSLPAVAPPAWAQKAKPRPAATKTAPVSDALKAARPADGEWFGLYLMGKKVGHIYTHLEAVPGQPDKARVTNEFVFKANVGSRISERRLSDVRIYESKPNGRLLSFVVKQTGDGGDQTIEGTNTEKGLHIVRKRPGQANDVRNLPASPETIEAADQARVALLRGKALENRITDGTDLETYKVSSKVLAPETRVLGGVKVKLRRVSTISEKEKVPTTTVIAPDGSIVEVVMGETMRAAAETKEIAQQLDKVEVFGLTRVVLPKAITDAQRRIPGEVRFTVSGLPKHFHKDNFRQKHLARADGRTEIVITAAFPSKDKRKPLPLTDPNGGEYLKSTLIVESDHADIVALSKKIVGAEKDAYAAAKRINDWVHANLKRDYGSSADRASDVLRQMKGDCTEHSLLAVALMRAAGIPAKRVDGLVYLMNDDGVPALYWHEWVEAYVGEWTQLDPTFNQTVADATHLALGEEGSAEITPLIGTLKVEEVR